MKGGRHTGRLDLVVREREQRCDAPHYYYYVVFLARAPARPSSPLAHSLRAAAERESAVCGARAI